MCEGVRVCVNGLGKLLPPEAVVVSHPRMAHPPTRGLVTQVTMP